MSDMKLEVKGIGDLVRAFRAVDKSIPGEFRTEMLGIATDIAGETQQRMPWQSGKAAKSVRPRASQKGAGVAFGGSAAPYMPWLDFGGSVGRGHKTGVPWSGSVKRDWMGRPNGMGRYVYPTIVDNGPEIDEAAEKAVLNAAKRAQFEVR